MDTLYSYWVFSLPLSAIVFLYLGIWLGHRTAKYGLPTKLIMLILFALVAWFSFCYFVILNAKSYR